MKKQITSLDGMRGLAALSIMFFHAGIYLLPMLGDGYLAVDLFFVLSGFVICSTYGVRLANADDIPAFVIRRLGRLWPVHVAALILFIASRNVTASILYSHTIGFPPSSELAAALTMVHGLNLFDHLVGEFASWSAADEFYIYLMFAAVCLFATGKRRIAIFALLSVAAWTLCVWASGVQDGCLHHGRCLELTFRYGWARCIAGFFLGALLAEYRGAQAIRALSGRRSQLIVAAVVLAYANLVGTVHGLAFAAPLVFVLLIASVLDDEGPVVRFFQRPTWQYLGKVSYSLYLGHEIVLGPVYAVIARSPSAGPGRVLAAAAIFVAGSILLAHVLYRFIEAPCRTLACRVSDARGSGSGRGAFASD